jgi:hypothetical protein
MYCHLDNNVPATPARTFLIIILYPTISVKKKIFPLTFWIAFPLTIKKQLRVSTWSHLVVSILHNNDIVMLTLQMRLRKWSRLCFIACPLSVPVPSPSTPSSPESPSPPACPDVHTAQDVCPWASVLIAATVCSMHLHTMRSSPCPVMRPDGSTWEWQMFRTPEHTTSCCMCVDT